MSTPRQLCIRALINQPRRPLSRQKLLITILAPRNKSRSGLAPNNAIFGVTARAAEFFERARSGGSAFRAALENVLERFSVGH